MGGRKWGQLKASRKITALTATKVGHVAVLDWMLELGTDRETVFEWYAFYSAEGGHVSVLDLLNRHPIQVEVVRDIWKNEA
jgi:hypothetical protein